MVYVWELEPKEITTLKQDLDSVNEEIWTPGNYTIISEKGSFWQGPKVELLFRVSRVCPNKEKKSNLMSGTKKKKKKLTILSQYVKYLDSAA